MKKYNILVILALFSYPLSSISKTQTKTVPSESSVQMKGEDISYQSDKKKQNSQTDGTTSASKLRAIRSHKVSDKDETKLAVFSGAILISVILFFLDVFRKKK